MLFVQDVYAAKGSKTFWHYNIGYDTKWENSNICNYSEYCKNEKLGFFISVRMIIPPAADKSLFRGLWQLYVLKVMNSTLFLHT